MIRETCGTVRGWIDHQTADEDVCGFCVRAERVAHVEAERFPTPAQTTGYRKQRRAAS